MYTHAYTTLTTHTRHTTHTPPSTTTNTSADEHAQMNTHTSVHTHNTPLRCLFLPGNFTRTQAFTLAQFFFYLLTLASTHSCPRMHSAAHIRGKPAWIDGQSRQLGFSSKLKGYILPVIHIGGGHFFGCRS